MKNKEFYQKELAEIALLGNKVALVNGIPVDCTITNCKKCDFSLGGCAINHSLL